MTEAFKKRQGDEDHTNHGIRFFRGTSFDQYIKDYGGKVSYEEAEKILLPVMDALAGVHAKGKGNRTPGRNT